MKPRSMLLLVPCILCASISSIHSFSCALPKARTARRRPIKRYSPSTTATNTALSAAIPIDGILHMDQLTAESIAGPFFGASLFPYLAFLYFLSKKTDLPVQVQQNKPISCPPSVVVGFAACLVFVFLTIPAAIAAKLLYGVSLADADWLHGSAESTLTVGNLALVLAFRSAVLQRRQQQSDANDAVKQAETTKRFVIIGCSVAILTAFAPILGTYLASSGSSLTPDVNTPYLSGILDLPETLVSSFGVKEPANALTVATWIIHISSVVEFLVAMGFCWEWSKLTNVSEYRGLTLALVPLHSSGITACVSHVFYNEIYMLVPLQALLTCVGNTTAAYAAWRISLAISQQATLAANPFEENTGDSTKEEVGIAIDEATSFDRIDESVDNDVQSSSSLIGFEDLGEFLQKDTNALFLGKLLVGTGVASYAVKYGGVLLLPFLQLDTNPYAAELAISCIVVPSMLNAYKWYQRGLQED